MKSLFSIISLLIFFLMNVQAQDSNRRFSSSLTTTASQETIWQIWTDIDGWPKWDTGLHSAELYGDFSLGVKGKLIPDKGPSSKFSITDYQAGNSYTFTTKLPLGALHVKRELSEKNGQTQFTHEVWFSGLSRGLFAMILGKRYRELLPGVLENIREIAEG